MRSFGSKIRDKNFLKENAIKSEDTKKLVTYVLMRFKKSNKIWKIYCFYEHSLFFIVKMTTNAHQVTVKTVTICYILKKVFQVLINKQKNLKKKKKRTFVAFY